MNDKIKISVRELIEFALRSGNIDSAYFGSSKLERAQEGSRLHRSIQKKRIDSADGYKYEKEFFLKYIFEFSGFSMTIEGRADGIFFYDDGKIIIEEIKSSAKDLEQTGDNILHWSQAKFYAYMFMELNDVKDISIMLTYVSIYSEQTIEHISEFHFDELKKFFYDVIEIYFKWYEILYKQAESRNASIKNLPFPFPSYRKGQRDIAYAIYKTIEQGKKIFAVAPTGTGKTISSLFPSIKAMGEGLLTKIFYLTAKTITRQAAVEAFHKLFEYGLSMRIIVLTAKEKMCANYEILCTPETCQYAKGHFDRINKACEDIFSNETIFDRTTITDYAIKHCVCPFEYALDLSLSCDCIICDYNYAFDPRVYLRRFFDNPGGEYVFLVDEAHNLVDRARSMFSASISKHQYHELKKLLPKDDRFIIKTLNSINKYFIETSKLLGNQSALVLENEPTDMYNLLRRLAEQLDEWFERNEKSEFHDIALDVYFRTLDFIKISDYFDERYVCYYDKSENDPSLNLFCIDPSYLLSNAQKRSRSSVFFSATLTPLNFYSQILGGNEDSYNMKMPSPFSPGRLKVFIQETISTKYRHRESSYEAIADYLYVMTETKKGNYIAFFASYEYLNRVLDVFTAKYESIKTIVQEKNMSENDRESFLESFKHEPSESLLAFGVLGGLFSEGIDLIGDRLIGVAVISVGLPKISFERDLIQNYFNKENNLGYEYAYIYPGINKVLQAAGRVIRTETDKGIVMLFDTRYLTKQYRELMPYEWPEPSIINSKNQFKNQLISFWNEQ